MWTVQQYWVVVTCMLLFNVGCGILLRVLIAKYDNHRYYARVGAGRRRD